MNSKQLKTQVIRDMMTCNFVRLSVSEVLEEIFCLHLKENKTAVNSLM